MQRGSKGARRRMPAQTASTRSAGSLRPFHQRQRQDRRHLGNGSRRLQPARPEALERVVGELHLPDPDPVGASVPVGVEVVRERLPDGRDLGDREARHQRRTSPRARSARDGFSSCCATSVPEPPPSPGPGCVLAPMCQTPGTGVRWPGCEASGRQRKFWSSASEPP